MDLAEFVIIAGRGCLVEIHWLKALFDCISGSEKRLAAGGPVGDTLESRC